MQVCNPSYSEGKVGMMHADKLDEMVSTRNPKIEAEARSPKPET